MPLRPLFTRLYRIARDKNCNILLNIRSIFRAILFFFIEKHIIFH
nr:MAG TPA: hypothetical protein [Caudoviricetes sp.]